MKDLNIKLLGEYTEKKLLDNSCGHAFWICYEKYRQQNQKQIKWDDIKLERFCMAKETTQGKGNLQNRRKYLQTIYLVKD